jgi:phosphoribosylglycinamide formyltransferase-1
VKRIVILISGRGSNMQSLLEAKLPCVVAAVISNKADAAGLEIAKQHGIATATISHKDFASRESFDAALAQEIDHHQPDFVVLAGFMRILTAGFVNHYAGRLINIHPSLLPAYTGVNTHERAIKDGVKVHGCSVHFVTADLDHGPIIIQAAIPVRQDDSPQTVSARVLHEEHRIFPQAVRWLCDGAVRLNAQGRVETDRLEQRGTTLISPGLD